MTHTTPPDYAAKLHAEAVTDLSDASLAATFAHCVRPARPAEYDAIRDAYRVGYLAGYETVATLPLFEVTA